MLRPVYFGQFGRDIKRAEKRGEDMVKFETLAHLLLGDDPLPLATRITR